MIELLGSGMRRGDGSWLLHGICTRLEEPGLVMVVSRRADERLSLLRAVAGRLIPPEGRVWVDGVPLMPGTRRRIRELAATVELRAAWVGRRSLLWNVLAERRLGLGILASLLRLPGRPRREAAMRSLGLVGVGDRAHDAVATLDLEGRTRLALARALARCPRHLVLEEPDAILGLPDAERFLGVLSGLARLERMTVLVSLAHHSLALGQAHRLLVLSEGLLVFDGPAVELVRRGTRPPARWINPLAPAKA